MAVELGKRVSIEYTLRLDEGAVVDSNVGGEPLTYTHGRREIIPGLEDRLGGLNPGDTCQVSIPPDRAYGPVDPEAFHEVPRDQIPPEAHVAGALLMARGPEGDTREVRVHEVRPETVVVDLNHPLAGCTLHFDVKILAVE